MNIYTIRKNKGKPAIYSQRGLVCVFEAVFTVTREQDSKAFCQNLNLLADAKMQLANLTGENLEAYAKTLTKKLI